MIQVIDILLTLIMIAFQVFFGMLAIIAAIYVACLFLSIMPFVIFFLCCIAVFKGVLK